jgi:hypothetical protein
LVSFGAAGNGVTRPTEPQRGFFSRAWHAVF